MVIWYCETLPVFVEATTRNCHTLHSYWDLSLLVSNMKSKSNPAFLGFSLSFAFLPKVDGGSQFGKTVLFQQNVNIVCIFHTGTRLSFAHFRITLTMFSTWKTNVFLNIWTAKWYSEWAWNSNTEYLKPHCSVSSGQGWEYTKLQRGQNEIDC